MINLVFSKLKVEILSLDQAEAVWAQILGVSPAKVCSATVYQTPAFLQSWLITVGIAQKIKPFFINLTDAKGGQMFLPLGISQVGSIYVAQFLGGKHANFNVPLFNTQALAWKRAQIVRALREAGALAKVDVFRFINQPVTWQNTPNPLCVLGGQDSPSSGYSLTLQSDAEALFAAQLSKDARKKLRYKENTLAKMGDMQCFEAENFEQQQDMLTAYFEQKAKSLNAKGIKDPFSDFKVQEWLRSMPCLRLFGLTLNGHYQAIWGMGVEDKHVSGMFTSFASDGEAVRVSPGEVLLRWIIRKMCIDGMSCIDFGVGEARYKDTWSNEVIALKYSFIGVSLQGFIVAFGLSLIARLKRQIKKSPRLMKLMRKLI